MDILKEFGVQPVLLLAQTINFLVLLFLLKKFLYKPMLKMLEERKQKIAESLKNAEQIQKNLEKSELEREKMLDQTSKDVSKIILEAQKDAQQIVLDAHDKAAEDIKLLVEKTKQSMELERQQMNQQMRSELAQIVSLSLEKITGKSLSDKDKKDIIERSIK